jgi:uracil-DNA glycosylase family 4
VGERERYLRQQMELGGGELVLSRKATELVTVAPPATRSHGREESAATPARATLSEVPSLQDTGQVPAVKRPEVAAGAWRKNAPPIPGPGLSYDPPAGLTELATLDAVAAAIASCRKCGLCERRTHTVPGEGDTKARFVVVGEGPGATEDETGRPFVGRAGELLDSILGSIDIPRRDAFILNIVKCRPPENRKPLPDEMDACAPYLHRQLAILRPKVILAAGSTAISGLLQTKQSLGQLRGQVHRYAGIPVIATYHPAALLRNPNWKKPTWDDVRIARQLLDI